MKQYNVHENLSSSQINLVLRARSVDNVMPKHICVNRKIDSTRTQKVYIIHVIYIHGILFSLDQKISDFTGQCIL